MFDLIPTRLIHITVNSTFNMLQSWRQALWALLLLVSVAQAQFNFFDQMFGGGEQQQRQQQRSQNSPSDSSRYQQMWSGGKEGQIPALEDITRCLVKLSHY